jgi:RNA polymerase sigma-70 factor (ECF subfamily)
VTAQEYNRTVDEHADGVYRFILHNIKDKDDAKDVVQDAFEKFWKNHENVQFEKAKSYLFTAAYHTMIDRIRRAKKMEPMDDADYNNHSHTKQYSDLKDILRDAVNKLPEIQRNVVLLRDYEGYSYEEIGKITGLNESQVKVYLHRARLQLREYIVKPENII